MSRRPQSFAPLAASLALAALGACAPLPAPDSRVVLLDSPAALAADGGDAATRSLAPRLARGPEGTAVLSWIEESDGSARLRFSTLVGDAWSAARTAAEGADWFVNWADTPSVTPLGGGVLLAHWLQKSGDAPYAYAVRMARSADGGASWSAPISPHADASPTEHGFVSVVPDGRGGADVVWLDGRAMASGHSGGATALMHAAIDATGGVGPETVLDPRVCDCCSTSAARLEDGSLVVAWRDRADDETRDVSVAVRTPGGAVTRARVPGDGWVIAGCPVNGPSLAAEGTRVALAWFTLGSDGTPRVRASVSTDGGASFGEPAEITGGSAGTDPIGRVAVVPDGRGSFAVSYIADLDGETRIVVTGLDARGQATGDTIAVATTSRSRSSGFPVLLSGPAGALLAAWTEPGETSRVLTARVEAGPAPPQASAAPSLGAESVAARAGSIRSRPERLAR